jgi:protein-L-isoaspartate(D-aspartate) O-methyltransferase
MQFDDQRKWLVKKLADSGIKDLRVLEAFAKVPRHEFVPPAMLNYAYHNQPLMIGEGQTISQPLVIAMMMQALQLQPTDIVLEIGTGSGYQTALLAEITKEVFTVERIEKLASRAKAILKKLNYTNIHYRLGDGTRGWEKAFPPRKEFNKIVVSAGSPQVPPTLVKQLAEGGIMVIPVGERMMQRLLILNKKKGEILSTWQADCTFVPLIGEEGWEIKL